MLSNRDLTDQEFDVNAWLAEQSNLDIAEYVRTNLVPLMLDDNVSNKSGIYRLILEGNNANSICALTLLLKEIISEGVEIKYYHDLLALYKFMMNENDFSNHLCVLENELQTYLQTSLPHLKLPTNQSGKYHLNCDDMNTVKTYKILSGYLSQWASNQGFEYMSKTLDYLDGDMFRSLLRSKTIMKDSTKYVKPSHGKWSHCIQWRVISLYNDRARFLQHSLIDLYQLFGNLKGYFWDTIFDAIKFSTGYANPVCVTEFITDNPDKLPLLYATVKRHMHKLGSAHTFFNNQSYKDKQEQKHCGDLKVGYCLTKLGKN